MSGELWMCQSDFVLHTPDREKRSMLGVVLGLTQQTQMGGNLDTTIPISRGVGEDCWSTWSGFEGEFAFPSLVSWADSLQTPTEN